MQRFHNSLTSQNESAQPLYILFNQFFLVMKTYPITLLLIILTISSFGQNTAIVSGEIINPKNNEVYLRTTVKGENGRLQALMLDSASLNQNNRFRLQTELDSTSQVTFYDGNEVAQMLLSPGDSIHLTLNTAAFDETIQFYGKGSEKNNAIAALMIFDEMNMIPVRAGLESDPIDSTEIFSQYDQATPAYLDLVKSYQKKLPEFSAYGDQLIEKKEVMGKSLKNLVREKITFRQKMAELIGKEAVDFTGVDLEGNEISLSDFKGKTTVVDFWATWCGPCKAEFPAYKDLEEEYGDEVNFVSVGVYCSEDEWREMALNEGFSHNIFLSKEATSQIADYDVRYIPRYLVLNEDFELIDFEAPRPSSGELESYWLD